MNLFTNRETKEAILKRIGDSLATFEEVELGYVHGSFLEKESFGDIDLAMRVRDRFSSSYEKFKYAMRVGRSMEGSIQPRTEVDVKVLNPSPTAFQFQVLKKGRRVYARSDLDRIRYEADVLSEYQDYKPVLDWFNERYLARGG